MTFSLSYPQEQNPPDLFFSDNSLSRAHNWVCAIRVPCSMHITLSFISTTYESSLNPAMPLTEFLLMHWEKKFIALFYSFCVLFLKIFLASFITNWLIWFMFFAIFFIASHEFHCLKDFFLPQLAALAILHTHAAFLCGPLRIGFWGFFRHVICNYSETIIVCINTGSKFFVVVSCFKFHFNRISHFYVISPFWKYNFGCSLL